MDKNRLEKEELKRKLEELLLERLEGEATLFTHADFNTIKNRVAAKLKAKKDNQKSVWSPIDSPI